jgi:hypothetical protein
MRFLFTVIAIHLFFTAAANMASPLQRGSAGSISFVNENVNILEESVFIKPDAGFAYAYFKIIYRIETLQNGHHIPLLFHAMRYDSGFTVTVDGMPVSLKPLPGTFYESELFKGFSNYFEPSFSGQTKIRIPWSSHITESLPAGDLQFFETDLLKGKHEITVRYHAKTWVDRSGWIRRYSIPYALTPARFWKSFGRLTISVDGSASAKDFTCNFGLPVSGNTHTLANWIFDSIPQDIIRLEYEPVLSENAQNWIGFGPENMALVFAGLLVPVHFFLIYKNRKKNKSKNASAVFWIGTLLLPFLTLVFFIYSYSFIDSLIGAEASKRHGYTFMAFVLYPVLLVPYGIVMYLADYWLRKRNQ